jgi:hypothetical protein
MADAPGPLRQCKKRTHKLIIFGANELMEGKIKCIAGT